MLVKWRTKNRLTLKQAADRLGLSYASQVHYIENGINFPKPETIIQIEAATGGVVTVADHLRAWRAAHPVQTHKFRAVGRSAAKEHRPPAKTTTPRR